MRHSGMRRARGRYASRRGSSPASPDPSADGCWRGIRAGRKGGRTTSRARLTARPELQRSTPQIPGDWNRASEDVPSMSYQPSVIHPPNVLQGQVAVRPRYAARAIGVPVSGRAHAVFLLHIVRTSEVSRAVEVARRVGNIVGGIYLGGAVGLREVQIEGREDRVRAEISSLSLSLSLPFLLSRFLRLQLDLRQGRTGIRPRAVRYALAGSAALDGAVVEGPGSQRC